MKLSFMLVVGMLTILACLVLSFHEPPMLRTLTNAMYDAVLRQVSVPPCSDEVVIVDIDEASLGKYGQWPWPRYIMADLTERLFDAGASVIAYDIVFAEADGKSPAIMQREMRDLLGEDVSFRGVPPEYWSFDARFATALARGKTVLGCFMHRVERPVEVSERDRQREFKGYCGEIHKPPDYAFLPQAAGVTLPIPELADAAASTAFFNTFPDTDNIVRTSPHVWAYGRKRIYMSLALESVRHHLGAGQALVFYEPKSKAGVAGIRLQDLWLPTNLDGRMRVNYRSSPISTVPVTKVLGDRMAPGSVSNRIVFVGTSAPALGDVVATPLTAEFPGVGVHATLADNILAGDILVRPRWALGAERILILLLGLGLTWAIRKGRALLSFLLTVLVLLAAVQASILAIGRLHIVLVPAQLILSVFALYTVLTLLKYWHEERQRKQVREMFGTMVSRDVLRYMEENPQSFSLTGEKAEATMFFSDVADFTTISERLEPSRLSDLLNRYLTPMTENIQEHRGYVDKYNGDAIMAEWGVPFSVEDHAVHACLSALEQQRMLAELRPRLNEEFGAEIYVRMGVNSGTVTAGNMGSGRRFQYTVMGDAVNLAARFEPANKDYKTDILMGESTYRAAQGVVAARLLDVIVVVGKTKPMKVYELLAKQGELDDRKLEIVDLYQSALRLHWERQWADALAALEKGLVIDPEDGPSLGLHRRIAEYRENPPPEGWQGEYVRKTKY